MTPNNGLSELKLKMYKRNTKARVQPPGSTLTKQKIAGDKEKAQRRETV